MLYLKKHPEGPELPVRAQGKRFRSYVALAEWAEEQLLPGKYWVRNDRGTNLWTAIREARCKIDSKGVVRQSGFWVEGRGNI